jgi:hypothetical protein
MFGQYISVQQCSSTPFNVNVSPGMQQALNSVNQTWPIVELQQSCPWQHVLGGPTTGSVSAGS